MTQGCLSLSPPQTDLTADPIAGPRAIMNRPTHSNGARRATPQTAHARHATRPPAGPQAPAIGSALGPAAGDIVMAACQRSIALHAHWINESVNRTLEHAALHASGEAVASPAQHGEWMRTTLFEPTWHYMVGLMSLSRSTGNSLVTLMSSQMRGAQDEVDSLSREAHEEAVDAARTAASAAVAAMSSCAQAVSQLGERASQAAQHAARAAQGSRQDV